MPYEETGEENTFGSSHQPASLVEQLPPVKIPKTREEAIQELKALYALMEGSRNKQSTNYLRWQNEAFEIKQHYNIQYSEFL